MIKILCFIIGFLYVAFSQAAPDFNKVRVINNITFYGDDSISSKYYVFPDCLLLDSVKGHPNMYVNSFFQTTDNTIFNKNEICVILKKYKLNDNVINQAFSKIKIAGNENYKFITADKMIVQLFVPRAGVSTMDTLDLLSQEEMIKQISVDDKLILYSSLKYEDVSLIKETIFKHNTPLKIAYTFQSINCNSGTVQNSTNNICTLKTELIPFLIAQSDSEKIFTQKHIKLALTPVFAGVNVSNYDYCNGTDMLDSSFIQKIDAIQYKKIIITGESSGKSKTSAQLFFYKGSTDCNRYLKFRTAVFINKPISYTVIKGMEDGTIITSKPIIINDWNQIDISETYDN